MFERHKDRHMKEAELFQKKCLDVIQETFTLNSYVHWFPPNVAPSSLYGMYALMCVFFIL